MSSISAEPHRLTASSPASRNAVPDHTMQYLALGSDGDIFPSRISAARDTRYPSTTTFCHYDLRDGILCGMISYLRPGLQNERWDGLFAWVLRAH